MKPLTYILDGKKVSFIHSDTDVSAVSGYWLIFVHCLW